MRLLLALVAVVIAYSIGKALGWEQGYGLGYDEGQAEGVLRLCPPDENGYEDVNTDPVPLALTDVVRILVRDWGEDLKHEWEWNR